MIVCHQHRFIYIRTRKTASTSVALWLRQFCGPGDLITRDTPADERVARSLGVARPDYGCPPLAPWRFRTTELRRAVRTRAWPPAQWLHPHTPASEIRELVGSEVWDAYRKITVVRDPWEVAVSAYYWRLDFHRVNRGRTPKPGFTLDDAVERAGLNWETYTIDGVPVVDHVLRHERLATDLATLAAALDLEPRIDPRRMKSGHRPAGAESAVVLSAAQARRVEELAADEIAWLGYSWTGRRST